MNVGQIGTGFDRSDSRRGVLRMMGGLGLAAAGSVLLGPAAWAAAPSISNALLQIAVEELPVLTQDRRAQGRRIFENPFAQKATITVTATITFSAADFRAMRDGAKYRLGCEIWENDNDNQAPEPGIDQFVFDFPRVVYPKRQNQLPSRTEPVTFETTVTRASLDLDQPNPNGDEIVALLVLTTPAGQRVPKATNLVKLCPCQP